MLNLNDCVYFKTMCDKEDNPFLTENDSSKHKDEKNNETTVDPEKYFNKMKKKLKKYGKLNLSVRVQKLEKKIVKFEKLFEKDPTNFYSKLIRRSHKMLERAHLCQFLSLDLTEDVCMALLCVAEREFPESDCKLSYKAVLLNYISGRHDEAKTLMDAYNDIFGQSKKECNECDDVCVTFSENLKFPSIGYLG